MARGWSADGLPNLGDDPAQWTVKQACSMLGPPYLTETQLRSLITMASLQPVGRRRTQISGRSPGRHARVYPAIDLINLFEAVYSVTQEACA